MLQYLGTFFSKNYMYTYHSIFLLEIEGGGGVRVGIRFSAVSKKPGIICQEVLVKTSASGIPLV